MKLHNGMSPNGARVSIFLAEKGIDVPLQPVDIMQGETRAEPFLSINPLGEVPVLELDNGRYLTESIAICRYLEALNPTPALFGATPEEQAFVEMWNRRMELRMFNVLGDVGRHEFEMFKDQIEQVPAFARVQRGQFQDRLKWFDGEMSDGRAYVAGENFSVADITGMAMLLLCGFAQIDIPEELTHARRWAASVMSRASWPMPPA